MTKEIAPLTQAPSLTTKKKRKKPIDRRTAWYRRHQELVAAFAADLGPNLTATDRSVVAHAATIALECEKMQASQLAGEAIDLEQLVRLTNALGRIRKELSAKATAKPKLSLLQQKMLNDGKAVLDKDGQFTLTGK
jgi:hypothetical protein